MTLRTIMVVGILLMTPLQVSAGDPSPGGVAERSQSHESSGSEPYTVLGFYESGSFEGSEFVERMKVISDRLEGSAEITMIDVLKPGSRPLVERYRIYDVPYVLIVSPGGVVTGGIRGIPESSDILQAFVSGPMAGIIGAIQHNQIVVLIVSDGSTGVDGDTERSVAAIEKIFRASVKTMRLDTTVQNDSGVAAQLGIDTAGMEKAQVVVLGASGIVDRFQAPVSTSDLLGSFQKVLLSKSGCGGSQEGGLKSTCDD